MVLVDSYCNKTLPKSRRQTVTQITLNCKGNDIKLALIEKCITASTAAVIECANDLLKAEKTKSRFDYNAMFVKLTDAVSLLGHVNHELVGKRRKAIKLHLKEEYRPMCTANIPIGKLLFGEDLAKELRSAKEMSHCSDTVQNFS